VPGARGSAFARLNQVGGVRRPSTVISSSRMLVADRAGRARRWRWVVLVRLKRAMFGGFHPALAVPESRAWLAHHGSLERRSDRIRGPASRKRRRSRQSGPPDGIVPRNVRTRGAAYGRWARAVLGAHPSLLIVFNLFQTVGFYGFKETVGATL